MTREMMSMSELPKIGLVSMRVLVHLNEPQLAALLWDAAHDAAEEIGDREMATPLTVIALARVSDIRELVRARVAQHGCASVECGPQNTDGYTDLIEARCVHAVRRAFGSKHG